MLQRKIGFYWKICWGFIVPVCLSIILIGNLKDAGSSQLERQYPEIAIWFGWSLTVIGLLILPTAAIHAVSTRKTTGIINVRIKKKTVTLAYY